MKRHPLPTLVGAAALVIGLAACGDDTADEGTSLPEVTTPRSDPTSPGESPVGGYDHPTEADAVVFSYAEVGGFTTREFAFQRTPQTLVSGDGRVFSPGAQIAIYPAPLLPAIQVQPITEAGIQGLLAAADEAGLLADIDYEVPMTIADATTATVTINVNGETYVHEAYALGLGSLEGGGAETTPEREALAAFISRISDLSSVVGDTTLSEPELYEPEQYAVEAVPVEDLSVYGGDGIEPTVVEWPADASVALADAVVGVDAGGAAQCVLVSAAEFGDLFAQANQLTFFSDAGQVYQVLVRPELPGDDCES